MLCSIQQLSLILLNIKENITHYYSTLRRHNIFKGKISLFLTQNV